MTDIKKLKRENQNVRETINRLNKDKKRLAMELAKDDGYYSFLCGFDWVIDEIREALNKGE